MVIAVVPVGNARRLNDKHFLDFCGKRIIDVVVENLTMSGFFSKVVIYTVKKFHVLNAEIVMDNWNRGVLPVLIDSLKRYRENVFLLGGDMPLANKESFSKLIVYPESLSVIPKWKNGYIEPLHSLYSVSALNFFNNNVSMHDFIKNIPKVFVRAEEIDKNAFFNVNTMEDYLELKKICNGNI